MRKFTTTIAMMMAMVLSLFAQVPQTMSYQAVVRNAENAIVASQSVSIELSILQGSDDGTAVYTETHNVTTNANGLITLELGAGESSDNFSAIDWSAGPYFVKTVAEIDGKQVSGVSPMLVVPYAKYAETAGNVPDMSEYAKKSDIPADVDLSNYATKSEIPSLEGYAKTEDIPSLDGYAKTEDLPNMSEYTKTADLPTVDLSGYAKTSEIADMATKTYVDGKVAAVEVPTTVAELTDAADYAKTSDVSSAIATATTDMATKTYVDGKVAAVEVPTTVAELTDAGDYAKKSDIKVDLSSYYKKSDVDALIDNLIYPSVAVNGAIKALFSVSASKQVNFSMGNLQYKASTSEWRFAEHQYEMIGADNAKVASEYDGYIDMFGWGTSGYDEKYPYMTSDNNNDYYTENYIGGTNYDWGVYNAISNGGNTAGMWRTLSQSEWNYVVNYRTNANSLKGLATVNNVPGLILLPDNWTAPEGITFNNEMNDYKNNTYSRSEWYNMEKNGAVFLPATGYRNGSRVANLNSNGYYWTSSLGGVGWGAYMWFNTEHNFVNTTQRFYSGYSVRLAQDAVAEEQEPTTPEIDLGEYLKKSELDLSGYAKTSEIADMATKTYVDGKVAAVEVPTKVSDLTDAGDYAKTSEVSSAIATATTDMATKTYVDAAVAAVEVPTTVAELTDAADYANVQADWEETDATKDSYIKNKPTLATVATSGSYEDLSNKPTIPDVTGFATKTELEDYAKTSEVSSAITTATTDMATKTYVDDKVATVEVPTTVADLTDAGDYYKKSDVDALLAELTAKIQQLDEQLNPPAPIGAIDGKFSISADKQVYFSQGNLQYQASSNTWKFAENQYDVIGDNNSNISSTYSGWIDLFGWGTSGYKGKNPYMTSTSYSDYGVVGDAYAYIAGTNYDWGVYNKISNGGNTVGQWRTLTNDEWDYVLSKRTDASALKGSATVNGVTGMILLPDNWTTPESITFTNGMNGFDSNTYTTSDWVKMEANGAVFLPAAGYRNGSGVSYVGSGGFYWSSSTDGSYASILYFYSSGADMRSTDFRFYGQSVRLVRGLN